MGSSLSTLRAMSTAAFVTDSTPTSIPSAQVTATGVPRFHIPARSAHAAWEAVAALEAAGGVSAELRVFLDEQLATGDLLLDLAPGVGVVALSAATAPGGVATVLVAEADPGRLAELQDAAANAGAWLEPMPIDDWIEITRLVETRLEPEGRVFVHAESAQLGEVCAQLASVIESGALLALLVDEADGDGANEAAWDTVRRAGFTPCATLERDGQAVLVPVDGVPMGAIVAVPSHLFGEPADAAATAPIATSAAVSAAPRARAAEQGFSFIAPHSRTGYGITGANLLRALQARGVPVAFFPLGGVDPSLTDNPDLEQALRAQEQFPVHAPSVRLSQQFDLALHAGRGPRLAFTIFETETFSARDLHHLRMQDALAVCTPWAREVCHANGLTELPIHIVPLGVDAAVYHPRVMPARRWPDETVFLQVGKLETRKGQRELLRAFEAAFSPSDAVRLVLACHNAFMRRDQFDALLAPFRTSPMARRITLVTTELPGSADVAALMAAADCGVFPVRAEGWNLEAVEMMAMGKAIIASQATAHTAYMTHDNTRLITMGPPESAAAGGMLGTWPSWTDAQHEQLVEHLRAVHRDRQSGALGVNTGGLATAAAHSWDASADALLQAINSLR
jgi:glycosyltransferase involved in cell wall biosynthesis